MSCADCEKPQPSGSYNFKCESCRTRFIQSEPCKYLRKVLVEYYRLRYGEFTGWQEGKHCDCERVCKRKAAVTNPNGMGYVYEQQINTKTKPASRRR